MDFCWSNFRCAGGAQGVKNYFINVAYQIDRDDKQNRMQVKFSSWGQTGDLGVSIIEFWLPYQILRFLYQTLCAFLQINARKQIEQNFHSVAGVMPQGWDLGVLGGSKT